MPSPLDADLSPAPTRRRVGGLVISAWLVWGVVVAYAAFQVLTAGEGLVSAIASHSGALIVAATGWLVVANLLSLAERRRTQALEDQALAEVALLSEELDSVRRLQARIAADIEGDPELQAAIARRRVG
ncbi:MAG: hypothetical protein EON86_12735 [Brevundimonas sp.]|nr:MAG: hypothetical protein EON86_12735 [Brevundimonas sp.]